MHLSDLLTLARTKLGPGARFVFQVVDEQGDRVALPAKEGKGFLAQAEIFLSSRPGANVPDTMKTERVLAQAPFVPPHHDPSGSFIQDPSRDQAVEALAEKLRALPDPAASTEEPAPSPIAHS